MASEATIQPPLEFDVGIEDGRNLIADLESALARA
jgi:cystathionine beta-lyase/cystathionine gamma-synthase